MIIIGGAEDKTGESVILKHAAEMLSESDALTVITTATLKPKDAGETYKNVFNKLGIKKINVLHIDTRENANDVSICKTIEKSKCVFFTGGDQLRITSILGGTEAEKQLKEVYNSGGIIMGTSAGASVMSSTMIVTGIDNEPARKCTLKMAPGLALLENCIIDQHFDQRGRLGRLLCGIAENPGALGIGIDEDTAIKVYPDLHFEVLGSNAVTVIDGRAIESSNVSELKPDELLAIMGVKAHILPANYGYDMEKNKALRLKKNI